MKNINLDKKCHVICTIFNKETKKEKMKLGSMQSQYKRHLHGVIIRR